MRKIVHLSDLHFGRVDHALLEPLAARVRAIAPDLIAVSGDLTQRAKKGEFRAAQAFLDTLPGPRVVVPGNHDIPLYNVFQRFFTPLARYRRFVDHDVEPVYADGEIAVVGINTARSLTWKDGRINLEQVEKMRHRLRALAPGVVKVIVTHHPFDLPQGHTERDLVRRADMAMKALAECGADILLSGHLHTTHTTHSAQRYRIPGHSALIVQAGTATSVRARGESNSFNALHITRGDATIERWQWNAATRDFELAATERFLHAPDGWHLIFEK
jgi:3',5'-cyclic AMP phosphodiesterase CpdA